MCVACMHMCREPVVLWAILAFPNSSECIFPQAHPRRGTLVVSQAIRNQLQRIGPSNTAITCTSSTQWVVYAVKNFQCQANTQINNLYDLCKLIQNLFKIRYSQGLINCIWLISQNQCSMFIWTRYLHVYVHPSTTEYFHTLWLNPWTIYPLLFDSNVGNNVTGKNVYIIICITGKQTAWFWAYGFWAYAPIRVITT